MAQKWPKMPKKWPKNDPNDLKFWQNMYLGGFYWFPKFWKFSPKIARFSGKKLIFLKTLNKFENKNFHWKFWHLKGNGPIGLQIGINVPCGTRNTLSRRFLDILLFLPFYETSKLKKAHFLRFLKSVFWWLYEWWKIAVLKPLFFVEDLVQN